MQGYNLCMDDAGAKVELVNALSVRFECTVTEVLNRQNIICRSNALLEPGDYKAVAYSRGGDPEGQLLCDFRKVKYLKVVDPPTVEAFNDIPDDTELTFEFELSGESVEGEARLLAAVPIAQTPDGKCRVMTFKDGASKTEFKLGNVRTGTGTGFYDGGSAPGGEWWMDEVGIQVGENYVSLEKQASADHKSFTVTGVASGSLPPGTHENAVLRLAVTGDSKTEDLDITLAKLVVE